MRINGKRIDDYIEELTEVIKDMPFGELESLLIEYHDVMLDEDEFPHERLWDIAYWCLLENNALYNKTIDDWFVENFGRHTEDWDEEESA